MGTDRSLERRIAWLEDRAEIQELTVLYGFVMDERDESQIRAMFTRNAALRSKDGDFASEGLEVVVATFLARFAALGPTNHYSHGLVLRPDPGNPDRATGVVAEHAELLRQGVPMRTALRYHDVYEREDGRWKFAERTISYMYYLPIDEYRDMANEDSVRAFGDRRRPDWPESLYQPGGSDWLRDFMGKPVSG